MNCEWEERTKNAESSGDLSWLRQLKKVSKERLNYSGPNAGAGDCSDRNQSARKISDSLAKHHLGTDMHPKALKRLSFNGLSACAFQLSGIQGQKGPWNQLKKAHENVETTPTAQIFDPLNLSKLSGTEGESSQHSVKDFVSAFCKVKPKAVADDSQPASCCFDSDHYSSGDSVSETCASENVSKQPTFSAKIVSNGVWERFTKADVFGVICGSPERSYASSVSSFSGKEELNASYTSVSEENSASEKSSLEAKHALPLKRRLEFIHCTKVSK